MTLHGLYTGEWSVPACRLLLSSLEGKVYGLDIVTGKVFVTTFSEKRPLTRELFTLPIGCDSGEIFSPAGFQPLSPDSFLIADRYRNRLHLITQRGKVRKTLLLSSRGFFPRGNRIAVQWGKSGGAVLFFDSSSRGEILLVETDPFRVVFSTGKQHRPLSLHKDRLTFHSFYGDLVHTKEGFIRFTYTPSLYRERVGGAEIQNTLFSLLRDYGFSFALGTRRHPYRKSLFKPLLSRAELISTYCAGRKEALLLCYDDPRKRIFIMTPRGRVKTIVPWPETLSWRYPYMIVTSRDRVLFYGNEKRFELYETETALFP